MLVHEALQKRRSIRAFLPDPIGRAEISTLLSLAGLAPSGGNLQPWRVIAVTGEAREHLIAAAARSLEAAPVSQEGDHPVYPANLWEPYRSRRYAVGEALYGALGIGREDKAGRLAWFANNFRFFGAPVALFFVIDRRMGHSQWAHLGMMMQSLALAATARGLGTCMQEAWAFRRDFLHAFFGLEAEDMIACAMALGHPDDNAAVNRFAIGRADPAEFARFEGF